MTITRISGLNVICLANLGISDQTAISTLKYDTVMHDIRSVTMSHVDNVFLPCYVYYTKAKTDFVYSKFDNFISIRLHKWMERHVKLYFNCIDACSGLRKKRFSIVFKMRWQFRFPFTYILIEASLQNLSKTRRLSSEGTGSCIIDPIATNRVEIKRSFQVSKFKKAILAQIQLYEVLINFKGTQTSSLFML